MPLRLTYVLPFGPPATHFGGPVAQLALIAPVLAQRGHDVRLVCTDLGIDADTPRDTWLERDGYRIYYGRTAPLHRIAPYWAPMLRQPLEEAIADSDVVHIQLGLTLLGALARRVARRRNVPYVYAPRGSLCPHRLRDRRLGKWAFLRLFERRVVRDASKLHALTQKECDDLAAQGGNRARMCVVPNSVDMGDPAHWPDTGAAREQFDVPEGAVAVLFLGQLHAVKGLDLLIRAVAKVRVEHPNVLLLIAGPDAGYGDAARRLVRETGLEHAARFVGHLDGRAKLVAFRAADVFALTSHSEGLPNAVLEACGMSVPVVISDACRVPEVAEHAAGYVVQAEVDRIAAALAALVEDDEKRVEMGRAARALAQGRFSVERVATALEGMYESLTLPAREARRGGDESGQAEVA